MKLKLKIAKQLKRQLKVLSEKAQKERVDYVREFLLNHLQENKVDWDDKVKDYPQVLIKREEALKLLKEELEESDKEPDKKKAIMKAFYKDNHYYLDFVNKNRKLENLIIPLEDESYYGLRILAEKQCVTVEKYTTQLINHYVQNSQ